MSRSTTKRNSITKIVSSRKAQSKKRKQAISTEKTSRTTTDSRQLIPYYESFRLGTKNKLTTPRVRKINQLHESQIIIENQKKYLDSFEKKTNERNYD